MEYVTSVSDMTDASTMFCIRLLKPFIQIITERVVDSFGRHHQQGTIFRRDTSGTWAYDRWQRDLSEWAAFTKPYHRVYVLADTIERAGHADYDVLEAEIGKLYGVSVLDASLRQVCM